MMRQNGYILTLLGWGVHQGNVTAIGQYGETPAQVPPMRMAIHVEPRNPALEHRRLAVVYDIFDWTTLRADVKLPDVCWFLCVTPVTATPVHGWYRFETRWQSDAIIAHGATIR